MGFIDAIKNVFSHYADFNGRARRSEYWYFTLFNIIVSSALSGIGRFLAYLLPLTSEFQQDIIAESLSVIWSIAILIPSIALVVRRLHDIGKSGWSYLVILIPIVGFFIILVWVCTDSDRGMNEYGDSPKYPAYVDPYSNPYQPQDNAYNPYQQGNYYSPQPPQQNYYNPQQPNYYTPEQQYQPPVQQPYQPYPHTEQTAESEPESQQADVYEYPTYQQKEPTENYYSPDDNIE